MYKYIFLLVVIVLTALLRGNLEIGLALAEEQGVILDTVVASVDGRPVTLSDVRRTAPALKEVSPTDFNNNRSAKAAIEALIGQQVIEAEAEARNIKASPDDIERYIKLIAQRNKLTVSEFEKALKETGHRPQQYRDQVRLEILRTKLANSVIQSGAGVTAREIDNYLSEHPELTSDGRKLLLRQILIGTEQRPDDQARQTAFALREQLIGGGNFANAARQYSDGPEAVDGGKLGVVAVEQLSPEIQSVVQDLEPGGVSRIVRSMNGYHFFQVEQIFQGSDEELPKLRDEVRQLLEQEKLDSKLQQFFMVDLIEAHNIERLY